MVKKKSISSVKNLLKLFNVFKTHTLISIIVTAGIVAVVGATLVLLNPFNSNSNNICEVAFDPNGGTHIKEQKILCGSKAVKPNDPQKKGFKFKQWEYIGDKYDFNTVVKTSIILKAEYTPLENTEIVKVYFNTDGGSIIAPIEAAKGYTISKPANPTKDGYEFVEWMLNDKVFDFKIKIETETILMAKWKESKENKQNKNTSQASNSGTNSNNNDTSSGMDSNVPEGLKWEDLNGVWYLTGTDDVTITFTENETHYMYNCMRFNDNRGAGLPKNAGYTPYSVALTANVTRISKSSLTINNKYVFYRQKNYPSHIQTDDEKLFNNLQGTWYLEGYSTDVYVKFTSGIRYDEKVLYYEEHNFCQSKGVAYASTCNGIGYFSYYGLHNEYYGIEAYGWSYNLGTLYNSKSGSKLKFTKSPTSTSVKSISIDKNSINLPIGGSDRITVSFNPSHATNKNVSWTSSNNSIATVNNGVVTGISEGTAEITVTSQDGGKTAKCNVTVKKVNVTDISISSESLELVRGNSAVLTVTVMPNNATNKNVSWTSSDPTVATVNNGTVVAQKAGTTTITATTEDGGKQVACNVTVSNPQLTGNANIGVSTVATGNSITRGINVSINATGGSGSYNYYYIKLYKDGNLISETTLTYKNSLFAAGHTNGSYYAEFEIHDSEGAVYNGISSTTTVSGY